MIPRLTLGRLWLVVAVALPTLAALATPLSTVDLAYHVRAGQEILRTFSIPTVDTYTFTAAGMAWLDQQWGGQVILGAVHGIAGWEGLAVLRAVLVGGIFGLVLLACRLHGVGDRTAAALALGAFVVAVVTLALRPQLFGMALFAAALLVVAAARARPTLLWALPVIAVAWANVHGSFILAPALAGVVWLGDLASRSRDSRRSLLVLVATLVATAITPWGPGVWGYALGLASNPLVTDRITEWQPTSIRSFAGLAFFASALLVAAFLARRSQRAPWPTLAWLGFLFVVGVVAERGVAWWPLGAAVAVAGLAGPTAAEAVRRDRPTSVTGAFAVAFVLGGALLLPWWRPSSELTGRAGLLTDAPEALTLRLRDVAGEDTRVFAPQRWGSWIEWAVPEARVFVDSRIELFPVEVWQDEAAVSGAKDDWRAVLDEWGVDVVVTQAGAGDLGERLRPDPGWQRYYVDGEGAIFTRS